MEKNIEVIDITEYTTNNNIEPKDLEKILKKIENALESMGCFYVIGHGIPQEIISEAFSESKLFFHETPISEKMKYVSKEDIVGRGYSAFRTENVAAFMGEKDKPNDLVEKFSIGPIKPMPVDTEGVNPVYWVPNIWPEKNEKFKSSISNYFTHLDTLYPKILSLISLSLSLPQNTLFHQCQYSGHSLKINFYPQTQKKDDQPLRMYPHKDGTPITILAMDHTPESLSVLKKDGTWCFVDPIPGSLFINLGEILPRWSNDRYVATLHCVNWTPEERLSMAFFVLLNSNAMVGSLVSGGDGGGKYPPMSYGDWLKEKMDNMYFK